MCLRLFRRKKVNTAKIVPISKNPLFLKMVDEWYDEQEPSIKKALNVLFAEDLD